MVNCAKGAGQPPPELLWYWWYGAGSPDDEYKLVYRAMSVGHVYGVVKRAQDLQGAAIHTLSGSERRMLKNLKDEGLL